MAYPFQPIEHCIYKNTFLKDVRVTFTFQKADTSNVNVEQLQHFFNRFSGAKISAQHFLEKGRIDVFSSDHNIEFRFGLEASDVKVCTPVYTSFDQSKAFWQLLMEYIEILGVNTIDKLSVRKYSALYFKIDGPDYDVRKVMSEVFTGDIMACFEGVNFQMPFNSIEKSWSADDEDTATKCNIVFGFKKSDTAEKNDHLTLVTSVESAYSLPVAEVMNKIETYNKILFDAFHWCIKKSIIKSLK